MCALDLNVQEGEKTQEYLQSFELFRLLERLKMMPQFDARMGSYYGHDPYCLMGNHYHLLIKTPLANLSRAMRHINGVYTQRYNRSNKTGGPLFRGRYKAILVDSDAYLLHLSKYIHLNPISAGMVDCLDSV